jgi:hypothetical protein
MMNNLAAIASADKFIQTIERIVDGMETQKLKSNENWFLQRKKAIEKENQMYYQRLKQEELSRGAGNFSSKDDFASFNSDPCCPPPTCLPAGSKEGGKNSVSSIGSFMNGASGILKNALHGGGTTPNPMKAPPKPPRRKNKNKNQPPAGASSPAAFESTENNVALLFKQLPSIAGHQGLPPPPPTSRNTATKYFQQIQKQKS